MGLSIPSVLGAVGLVCPGRDVIGAGEGRAACAVVGRAGVGPLWLAFGAALAGQTRPASAAGNLTPRGPG